jgi:hypothetical protein
MSEVVILVMVTNYGVFDGNCLSLEMSDVLSNIEVPHIDASNEWSKILWGWVRFCQMFTRGSDCTCVEMSTLFIRCSQIITDKVSEDNMERHPPVRLSRNISSMKEVVLTEDQIELMCLGMNTPQDLTDDEEELCYLNVLVSFMKGDFTQLTSLILQMQITRRVIKMVTDDKADLTEHVLEREFSSLRLEGFEQVLLDTDTRYQMFAYPQAMCLDEKQFVEAEVSIYCSTDQKRQYHRICLPLVVFAYLFTDECVVRDLKQLLASDASIESINSMFRVAPREDMVKCEGVDIPRRWLKYRGIKELM